MYLSKYYINKNRSSEIKKYNKYRSNKHRSNKHRSNKHLSNKYKLYKAVKILNSHYKL